MAEESIAASQLRAFIERAERLNEEKVALNEDLKEIFAEARGNGFDVKVMKAIISDRAKDPDKKSEFDAIYELYAEALGMTFATRAGARDDDDDDDLGRGADVVVSDTIDRDGHRLRVTVDSRVAAVLSRTDVTTKNINVPAGFDPETGEEITTPNTDVSDAAAPADVADADAGIEAEGSAPASIPATEPQPPVAPDHHVEANTVASDLTEPPSPHGQVAAHPEAKAANDATSGSAMSEVSTVVDAPQEAEAVSRASVGAGTDATHLISNDRPKGQAMTSLEPRQMDRQAVTGGESAATNSGAGKSVGTSVPAAPVYESHPSFPMKRLSYAHCFPEVTPAEFAEIKRMLASVPDRAPLVIRMGDVVVDGWENYCAARDLGVRYEVRPYSGDDVLMDVIRWQRFARGFTPAQERQIAARLAKEVPHRADEIMDLFGLTEVSEAAE